MKFHISSLSRDTKFDEIARKFTRQDIRRLVQDNQVIPKYALDSERDILRTIGAPKVSKIKNTFYFKATLYLLKERQDGFVATDRMKHLIKLIAERDWTVSFLLGLSIVSYPRVKALYDMLLEGAVIRGRMKNFPNVSRNDLDTSLIYQNDEECKLEDAVTERINNNKARYIEEPMQSLNLLTNSTTFDNLGTDFASLMAMDLDVTWNLTTLAAYSKLCGFGQSVIERFFTINQFPDYSDLSMDKKRFFMNNRIREGLEFGLGFEEELHKAKRFRLSSEDATHILESYKRLRLGFDWVPWGEMREALRQSGYGQMELHRLEKKILSNQKSNDYFLLDNEIAIRTKTGPPGAKGILGRPRHAYVIIWSC